MDFISDSNKSGRRLMKFVTSKYKYEYMIVFLFSFLLFLSPSFLGYLIHSLLSFFALFILFNFSILIISAAYAVLPSSYQRRFSGRSAAELWITTQLHLVLTL